MVKPRDKRLVNAQYVFTHHRQTDRYIIVVRDRGVVQSRRENITAEGNCIKLA